MAWGGEKLHGRVAFVTGGIRGIGAAICKSLGNQHATVAAGHGHNVDRANAFADEHEKLLGVAKEAAFQLAGPARTPQTGSG